MKSGAPSEHLEPWLSEASDASAELRAFLREANTHSEDAARVERLRQRLGPWLAATTVPPPPPTPTGAGTVNGATTLSGVGKACLVALGAGALVTSAALLVDSGSHSPVAPAPQRTASVRVPPEVAPTPPLPPPSASVTIPAPVEATRPRALPSLSAKPPTLAEEAAELAAAQRALATSPAEGLALLGRHAAKHPQGRLAEERYVFTIEALVTLSRLEEAKRELTKLERGFPRSAHLGRARRLVGIQPPSQ